MTSLFSTNFDSTFSESSHFPDFYVRTFNFGGRYLNTRSFFGKTLLLNAIIDIKQKCEVLEVLDVIFTFIRYHPGKSTLLMK